MKVLFCARSDLHKNPAGDTLQIRKTAEYLRANGVQVDLECAASDYARYDLVHLFNLTPIEYTYRCFQKARLSGTKTVISPIYWDLTRYYRFCGSTDRLFLWNRNRIFRKEILEGCAMIYPSGEREMASLQQESETTLPYTVIYNGVDAPPSAENIVSYHTRFVLCAARICPRKNQLALASACNALGIPLILAGNVNNEAYLKRCLSYPDVAYAGFLEPPALSDLYAKACLHVLASFAETPGLASLEAAASGCRIVSTSESDAAEYFGDMASYCSPYDVNDIVCAMEQALSQDNRARLQAHIRERFGWQRCLAPLYASYLRILG